MEPRDSGARQFSTVALDQEVESMRRWAADKKAVEDRLALREADLERREKALSKRERDLAAAGVTIRPKNWPRCKPVTYHDISFEIPVEHQNMVYGGYLNWILGTCGFLWVSFRHRAHAVPPSAPTPNPKQYPHSPAHTRPSHLQLHPRVDLVQNWITMLTLMAMSGPSVSTSDFFLAALALVIGIPFTWMGWYRSLYSASQTAGAFLPYFRLFALLSLHIVWCVWVVVAPPVVGNMCAGAVTLIDRAHGDTVAVIFIIINLCVWGIHLLFSLLVLTKAIRAYKGLPPSASRSALEAAADNIIAARLDAAQRAEAATSGGELDAIDNPLAGPDPIPRAPATRPVRAAPSHVGAFGP